MTSKKVVVTGIIRNGNMVLLGKQKSGPFKLIDFGGQWVFPSGSKNGNEKVETTLAREMKEETGLEVKPEFILDSYLMVFKKPGATHSTISVWIVCSAKSPDNAKAKSDLAEVKWVPIEELPKYLPPTNTFHSLMSKKVRQFFKMPSVKKKIQKIGLYSLRGTKVRQFGINREKLPYKPRRFF